jgi:hypothetical protein
MPLLDLGVDMKVHDEKSDLCGNAGCYKIQSPEELIDCSCGTISYCSKECQRAASCHYGRCQYTGCGLLARSISKCTKDQGLQRLFYHMSMPNALIIHRLVKWWNSWITWRGKKNKTAAMKAATRTKATICKTWSRCYFCLASNQASTIGSILAILGQGDSHYCGINTQWTSIVLHLLIHHVEIHSFFLDSPSLWIVWCVLLLGANCVVTTGKPTFNAVKDEC